jgi:RNA polymerase sigma factor (sigma-70 family)
LSEPTSLPVEDVDRFLVDQIRKGDQRAWRQLIDRYQGRLSAFARARLGQAADTEDVIQETFLGFLSSLPHYDESRSLETYLFAILRYKIGESLTRRERQPKALPVGSRPNDFDVDDNYGPVLEPETLETPSRIAAQHELTRRQEDILAAILKRLIAEWRDRDRLDDIQVIELLFYIGRRNKEAAEILGRDEKTIAGVKFRAVGRLREFLEERRSVGGSEETLDEDRFSADATIARVWRQRRLTCLKRSTIGAYLLGVLDEPWRRFTEFHLETVGCLMCRANRDDLAAPGEPVRTAEAAERLFQSSIGFLSRGPDPGAA